MEEEYLAAVGCSSSMAPRLGARLTKQGSTPSLSIMLPHIAKDHPFSKDGKAKDNRNIPFSSLLTVQRFHDAAQAFQLPENRGKGKRDHETTPGVAVLLL